MQQLMQLDDAAARIVAGHRDAEFEIASPKLLTPIVSEANKLQTLLEQLMAAMANLNS